MIPVRTLHTSRNHLATVAVVHFTNTDVTGELAEACAARVVVQAGARNDRSRVPEITLHVLGLLCGWPGALIAQRALRHKSRKRSFQVVFLGTVILNCGALIWVLAGMENPL